MLHRLQLTNRWGMVSFWVENNVIYQEPPPPPPLLLTCGEKKCCLAAIPDAWTRRSLSNQVWSPRSSNLCHGSAQWLPSESSLSVWYSAWKQRKAKVYGHMLWAIAKLWHKFSRFHWCGEEPGRYLPCWQYMQKAHLDKPVSDMRYWSVPTEMALSFEVGSGGTGRWWDSLDMRPVVFAISTYVFASSFPCEA